MAVATLVLLTIIFGLTSADAATLTYDGVLFQHSNYDYAPSVMFDGPLIKVWWCGIDDDASRPGDAIYYSEHSNSGWSPPAIVLRKTPGAWDGYHTCDPSVVKGLFNYGGTTYTYAMYYGATDLPAANTRIGVAFSNDGRTWVKNSANPIISPEANATSSYGAGMPTAYRENGTNSSVFLSYWDSTAPGQLGKNYFMYSSNGINFINKTPLPNPLYWEEIGEMAYRPSENKWYIATQHANNEIIYLYKTANPNLTSTWTAIGQFNSTLTGNLRNHNPGLIRLPNGDMYVEVNSNYKYVYFGTGTAQPGTWDIAQTHWTD